MKQFDPFIIEDTAQSEFTCKEIVTIQFPTVKHCSVCATTTTCQTCETGYSGTTCNQCANGYHEDETAKDFTCFAIIEVFKN